MSSDGLFITKMLSLKSWHKSSAHRLSRFHFAVIFKYKQDRAMVFKEKAGIRVVGRDLNEGIAIIIFDFNNSNKIKNTCATVSIYFVWLSELTVHSWERQWYPE